MIYTVIKTSSLLLLFLDTNLVNQRHIIHFKHALLFLIFFFKFPLLLKNKAQEYTHIYICIYTCMCLIKNIPNILILNQISSKSKTKMRLQKSSSPICLTKVFLDSFTFRLQINQDNSVKPTTFKECVIKYWIAPFLLLNSNYIQSENIAPTTL